jgi:hypothetical protein
MFKVILLAQKTGHTTICTVCRPDRRAFCPEVAHIKSLFLQNAAETFGLAIWKGHLLSFPAMFRVWIRLWDDGVMLFMLLSTIRFIHFKCLECVRREGGMSRRLVKNEQGDFFRVSFLKDLDCVFDLDKQLLRIPPCITV